MSRNNEEYKLHVAIIKHVNTAFPEAKVFHVPNQQKDATQAFFNKQLGVLPGVSDLIFGWSHRNIGVMEIKAEKGRLSTPQNKFISWAHSIGWSVGVARSVAEAHSILKSWGLTPRHGSILEPDLATKEEKRERFNSVYARQAPEKIKLPPEETSGSFKF